MRKDLTVLKLGGSLLTDKSKPYEARETLMRSIAQEIKICVDEGLIEDLVLVHGVGSFGHPPVLEYKLHKGYTGPEQFIPLSKTQRIVNEFRHLITKVFQEEGLPVNLLHPSSMVVAEKMKITKSFFEPLKGWMSLGMIPLLGGDLLYDKAMGFSVGSGDLLAVELANQLGAKRLIYAMDVDGFYSDNPKINKEASLMETISLPQLVTILKDMEQKGAADASGAMKGKLYSISKASDLISGGLEVSLVSMMREGNLTSLLKGQEVQCTKITHK
jgi:isopentenyl phosphate kinase